MCYKASNRLPVSAMESRYKAVRDPHLQINDTDFTSYHINGFAHPPLLMLGMESQIANGPRPGILHPALWGLLPPSLQNQDPTAWYRNIKYKGSELNARSEKAFDYFMYRNSIMEKRCIVPLTGFFEPHKKGKTSYPFYFERKDRDYLSVAGIYSITQSGHVSFTLFTKPATPLFAKVHNKSGDKRQIVLLDRHTEKDWLNPDLTESYIKGIFKEDFDNALLRTYPVSREINKRSYHLDGEAAIERAEYKELADLQEEISA